MNLESVDFDNSFSVYSDNQEEARYILTVSFMERLVKPEQLMGKGISFSFVNTFIYAAVPVKDNLFQPAIYTSHNYDSIEDYFNTVQTVFSIMDELNLNLRIRDKK